MMNLKPYLGLQFARSKNVFIMNLKILMFSFNVTFTWNHNNPESSFAAWMLELDFRIFTIGTAFRLYQL
jgi:hypothetical protein